ncbi:fluoride efflux transporter CrcB [Streptomyces sp. NPDC088745]|uniref:fluoride efflux transporter CrcB n=1 Tax=Streptomyces sp. NPDC088745 TaxID=3365884 RepID=UPI0038137812
MNWVLVLVGGAVGAPLRYLTDRAVRARYGAGFPAGTLVVNAAGSLLLGLVTGAVAVGAASGAVHLLVGTGLCGALTTYSTFSWETLRLAETGRRLFAAANVAVSVLVALGAVTAGAVLGRALGG